MKEAFRLPFQGNYITERLLRLVKDAGDEAIDIRQNKSLNVEQKGQDDFVTEGDRAVSRMITTALQTLFPEIFIVDEENPASYDMGKFAGYPLAAVIDPIDGTNNYRLGKSEWGISIGLFAYGKPVAGIIYLPDQDKLYYAGHGRGAYFNHQRIHVSKMASFKDAVLYYDFPYPKDELECQQTQRLLDHLEKICRKKPIKLGSQVAEFVKVAHSLADGAWMLKTKPWDVAGALCIVSEAGGKYAAADGSEYSLFGETIVFWNGSPDFEIEQFFEAYKQVVAH